MNSRMHDMHDWATALRGAGLDTATLPPGVRAMALASTHLPSAKRLSAHRFSDLPVL